MSRALRAVRAIGPAVLTTAGLCLLGLAATLAAQDRHPPTDFGRVPGGVPSSATVTRAPRHTAAPTGAPAPTAAPAPPTAVALPAIGVTASVLAVRARNGVLGVPSDPRELGWWADGALAGAPEGTVVIDGHVDSAASGEGALFNLGRLHLGDEVVVTTTGGHTDRFVVSARRHYLKAEGLPPDLFRTDGPPRLVLITCGGSFDRTAHSYLDNIVVFATPTV